MQSQQKQQTINYQYILDAINPILTQKCRELKFITEEQKITQIYLPNWESVGLSYKKNIFQHVKHLIDKIFDQVLKHYKDYDFSKIYQQDSQSKQCAQLFSNAVSKDNFKIAKQMSKILIQTLETSRRLNWSGMNTFKLSAYNKIENYIQQCTTFSRLIDDADTEQFSDLNNKQENERHDNKIRYQNLLSRHQVQQFAAANGNDNTFLKVNQDISNSLNMLYKLGRSDLYKSYLRSLLFGDYKHVFINALLQSKQAQKYQSFLFRGPNHKRSCNFSKIMFFIRQLKKHQTFKMIFAKQQDEQRINKYLVSNKYVISYSLLKEILNVIQQPLDNQLEKFRVNILRSIIFAKNTNQNQIQDANWIFDLDFYHKQYDINNTPWSNTNKVIWKNICFLLNQQQNIQSTIENIIKGEIIIETIETFKIAVALSLRIPHVKIILTPQMLKQLDNNMIKILLTPGALTHISGTQNFILAVWEDENGQIMTFKAVQTNSWKEIDEKFTAAVQNLNQNQLVAIAFRGSSLEALKQLKVFNLYASGDDSMGCPLPIFLSHPKDIQILSLENAFIFNIQQLINIKSLRINNIWINECDIAKLTQMTYFSISGGMYLSSNENQERQIIQACLNENAIFANVDVKSQEAGFLPNRIEINNKTQKLVFFNVEAKEPEQLEIVFTNTKFNNNQKMFIVQHQYAI